MSKKNCMVAQSGGPTVAINASLAGIINGVMNSNDYDIIYGSINGVVGLLENRIINLTELIQSNPNNLNTLKHSPAMYLGSCRYRIPNYKDDDSAYSFIFHLFEKLNIGAFFYIGGNDSMDTVLKLSDYAKHIGSDIRIIGVPKTIDNDLMITDHTPGFGSAAKYVASSLLEIAHDTYIYAVKSVTIVEIMGRDAGWLTAASALARNEYSIAPHLIYLPERDFDGEQFLEDIRRMLDQHDNVIVAISEGIHDAEGNYINAGKSQTDSFGHSQLSGAGKALEYLIKDNINVKVRSVEINVLQRCAAHLASQTDLDESFALGEQAVSYAAQGITASMVTMKRVSNQPYEIAFEYAEIKNIANEAKSVPLAWINEAGNDVTDEMLEYLTPLIQGEPDIRYQNGLPVYMPVEHLVK